MFTMLKENKLFRKIQNIPRQKLITLIVIVGIIAVCGIFLSESFSSADKSEKEESAAVHTSVKEYEEKTEKKLEQTLSLIAGIGKCKVMVTVDSGEESVYSSDTETDNQSGENSTSSSQKNTFVIVDDDGQKPLLEKEIEPKIRGVIVVCEGADDVYVRQAVTDSLRAALGISSANISVVKGGTNG